MESHNYLYFAYGSNLNPERMRRRIPATVQPAKILRKKRTKGLHIQGRVIPFLPHGG